MPSNTKENGFETLIVEYLIDNNGYEQGDTSEYNKGTNVAIDYIDAIRCKKDFNKIFEKLIYNYCCISTFQVSVLFFV